MNDDELQKCLNRMAAVTAEAEKAVSGLNEVQLNWKPDDKTWSIAECLSHIITSNSTYFPVLEQLGNNTYQAGWWQKINPFSRMLGKSMVNSLGKTVKRKYTSPRNFRPVSSNYSLDILAKFANHQQQFAKAISAAAHQLSKNPVVSSPAAKAITYHLDDMIELLTGHEERHLQQLIRLKAHTAFPQ